MSFLSENFSPIGGQARAGNAPAQWSYRSSTDSLETVLATGYFDEIATRLQATDYIISELSDTCAILTVETVTILPNASTVTINPIPFEPGQGNIQEGSDNPNGNVLGSPGDLYKRSDFDDSAFYTNVGISDNNNAWVSTRENSVLLFGCKSMTATTTVVSLLPGGQNRAAITNESHAEYPVPRDGILKNFLVRHNDPAGNGEKIFYIVFVNNVQTSIFVSLESDQSTGGTNFNSTDFVSVSAEDRIAVRAEKSVDVGTGPSEVYASLGFF